jgi:hypothetical protein
MQAEAKSDEPNAPAASSDLPPLAGDAADEGAGTSDSAAAAGLLAAAEAVGTKMPIPFEQIMRQFNTQALGEIALMEGELLKTSSQFALLAKYFGEDVATFKVEQFFVTFKSFLDKVDNVRKDVREQLAREERALARSQSSTESARLKKAKAEETFVAAAAPAEQNMEELRAGRADLTKVLHDELVTVARRRMGLSVPEDTPASSPHHESEALDCERQADAVCALPPQLGADPTVLAFRSRPQGPGRRSAAQTAQVRSELDSESAPESDDDAAEDTAAVAHDTSMASSHPSPAVQRYSTLSRMLRLLPSRGDQRSAFADSDDSGGDDGGGDGDSDGGMQLEDQSVDANSEHHRSVAASAPRRVGLRGLLSSQTRARRRSSSSEDEDSGQLNSVDSAASAPLIGVPLSVGRNNRGVVKDDDDSSS